jgi:nucleoside-triphosphatase THEP1
MNKHIEINIKQYLVQKSPEYAILISGKWGSGKTFFIDNFIENNEIKDTKFLKISLFGIKNISEINNKIIFKLLSIKEGLWSNATKIGVKVLDSYGKKLNLSIQDVPVEQIINKLQGEFIFIFDDLERTDINLTEILGYINYFVEQANFKVIILANEDEITDDKYLGFKEKVIGKTYEVQQNFDEIFNGFFNLVLNSKDILKKNSDKIKDLYIKSTYNNLRHIRQAVIDFDYFYNLLDNTYQKHNEFINNLIYVFFALSIEIKKGFLSEEEFENHNIVHSDFLSEEKEKETKFKSILRKYKLQEYDSLILSINIWINILIKNYFIEKEINNAISHLSYFYHESHESWYLLYYYWSMEDEEYSIALKDLINKFTNNEYLEHEKLLSVIALLLHLSKNDLCDISQDEIIIQAKKNIINNCQSELWKKQKYSYANLHDGYNYNAITYSYYDRESDTFKNIRNYLKEESLKAFNIGLSIKADELLLDFKDNNFDNIDKKLSQDFRDIDIFSYINKVDFQDSILTMKHKYLPTINTILENRYKFHELSHNNPSLVNELTLWEYIDNNILTKIEKNIKPIKYKLINNFKKNITSKIVENIKKAIAEKSHLCA